MLLLLLPIGLVGAPALLVLLAMQPDALVQSSGSMRHSDVGRIRELLRQHDPRGMRDGEVRRLSVTERDVNLMLDYSLRNSQRHRGAVDLDAGSVVLHYTLILPKKRLGKYANLTIQLDQHGNRLKVARILVGNTSVPSWLLNAPMMLINAYLRNHFDEYRGILAAVQEFQLLPDALLVVYQWRAELSEQIQARGRDLLLPLADRQRIVAYYTEIALQSADINGSASLTRLLQPLFVLARLRSAETGDTKAENRALLLALGLALNGRSISKLQDGSEDIPTLRPQLMQLTLQHREDLASHFALSAAIAAAAGSALADAAGVFKELDDSSSGAGFSFADLLADRAGVEFAKAALGERSANIQLRMATGPLESDYMPSATELPEGLMELEFKSRYEDLDGANYALVNAEIARRISTCALYR